MELIQKYTGQNEKNKENEVLYQTSIPMIHTYHGYDIVASFNGEVIGTLESIDVSVSRESSEVMEIEERLTARPYEGTITIDNSEINREMLSRLLFDDLRSTYEITHRTRPNREERRKKPSVRKAEEKENQFKKGLRKMLGGRRKWN